MRILLVAFLCLLSSAPALADKRIALLIGNQAYNASVGPLKNPHNDIAVVGKALAEVGFKLLAPRKDATRDEMLFAVHELAAQLRSAGRDAVSFLYYAGHGVAVGAENVLIPTNAENTSDAMLSVRGVRLGEILDILRREAPDAVHFVVLDACRNTLRGQRGARGFVPVADRRTGVVIAFSTAQGETATDEGNKSAPYAAALAAEIVKPGRSDLVVFHEVRTRVVRETGQTPWTHDGLVGDRVVFVPALAPGVIVSPSPPASNEAERAWDRTKDTTRIATLEAFIRRFGDTFYGDLAKQRLAELKQAESTKQAFEAAKRKADEDARAKAEAERQRVALLQQEEERRAEAKRKAEEEAATRRDPALSVKPGSGASFRDCPDCPEMVVVPAGSFTMGSPGSEERRTADEGPQRKVTIARPLAVGKFEVTFAEWDACVAADGCKHNPGDQGWGRGKRPVIKVSWNDAKEYVVWLSSKTGKTYRLLSEAEWEYAARAGTTTKYAFGDRITKGQAQYSEGTWGSAGETVEVGSFPANRYGLHDTHGNVWEWVEDNWHPDYKGAPTDGSVWPGEGATNRVLRGGSWDINPDYLRSAKRDRILPGFRNNNIGFRLSRTL